MLVLLSEKFTAIGKNRKKDDQTLVETSVELFDNRERYREMNLEKNRRIEINQELSRSSQNQEDNTDIPWLIVYL